MVKFWDQNASLKSCSKLITAFDLFCNSNKLFIWIFLLPIPSLFPTHNCTNFIGFRPICKIIWFVRANLRSVKIFISSSLSRNKRAKAFAFRLLSQNQQKSSFLPQSNRHLEWVIDNNQGRKIQENLNPFHARFTVKTVNSGWLYKTRELKVVLRNEQ